MTFVQRKIYGSQRLGRREAVTEIRAEDRTAGRSWVDPEAYTQGRRTSHLPQVSA